MGRFALWGHSEKTEVCTWGPSHPQFGHHIITWCWPPGPWGAQIYLQGTQLWWWLCCANHSQPGQSVSYQEPQGPPIFLPRTSLALSDIRKCSVCERLANDGVMSFPTWPSSPYRFADVLPKPQSVSLCPNQRKIRGLSLKEEHSVQEQRKTMSSPELDKTCVRG